MQHNYVNKQLNYVNIQHNKVASQHYFIVIMHVDINKSTCILQVWGRHMPP